MSNQATFDSIVERLDNAGLYKKEYLHKAKLELLKLEGVDDEVSKLLAALSPAATDEGFGIGACAYIGARANGSSHQAALELAVAKAGLLPTPTGSFRECHDALSKIRQWAKRLGRWLTATKKKPRTTTHQKGGDVG